MGKNALNSQYLRSSPLKKKKKKTKKEDISAGPGRVWACPQHASSMEKGFVLGGSVVMMWPM